jgi:hypothetical protein
MESMRRTTIALLAAGCALIAQAQTTTANLSGTITDSQSGDPIAGATVTFAFNSDVSATTNELGKFTLSGQVVGLGDGSRGRPGAASASGMILERGALRLDVAADAAVKVEVLGLDGRRIKTLIDRRLAAGSYSIRNLVGGLPAGIYLARADIGGRTATAKLTTMGLRGESAFGAAVPVFSRLAKQSTAQVIDTLKVAKEGYKNLNRAISRYEGNLLLNMNPRLPAGDLKMVSEKSMPQVPWGRNVEVQVWDGYTTLEGEYKAGPFEGANSWLITFDPEQTFNAWGFVADAEPEDMSHWADGHMHIALKGTVKEVGIKMTSADQMQFDQVEVKATAYGYKPDDEWHSLEIPSSDFTGVDFSQINVYLGLSVPDTVFHPDDHYQIDDVYWKMPAP